MYLYKFLKSFSKISDFAADPKVSYADNNRIWPLPFQKLLAMEKIGDKRRISSTGIGDDGSGKLQLQFILYWCIYLLLPNFLISNV